MTINQLKQEMEMLKSQLMGSSGINYNKQGDINNIYQSSASDKIARGEPPCILKKETSAQYTNAFLSNDTGAQYANTRAGTSTGNNQGF